jgi:hypothetical protein
MSIGTALSSPNWAAYLPVRVRHLNFRPSRSDRLSMKVRRAKNAVVDQPPADELARARHSRLDVAVSFPYNPGSRHYVGTRSLLSVSETLPVQFQIGLTSRPRQCGHLCAATRYIRAVCTNLPAGRI